MPIISFLLTVTVPTAALMVSVDPWTRSLRPVSFGEVVWLFVLLALTLVIVTWIRLRAAKQGRNTRRPT